MSLPWLIRLAGVARAMALAVLLAVLAANHFVSSVHADGAGEQCSSAGQCFESCSEGSAPSCSEVCAACGDGWVSQSEIEPGMSCGSGGACEPNCGLDKCVGRTCTCGLPLID